MYNNRISCREGAFKMKFIRMMFLIIIITVLRVTVLPAQTIPEPMEMMWFKADLHTHYTFENPLDVEVERYRETGYGFVVLSTKDMQNVLNYEAQSTDKLRIVNGVEQAFLTRKNMLGHVLAFRTKTPFRFTEQWTLKQGWEKLKAKNPNVILGINHPHDQRWTLDDVMEAWQEGAVLFELNSIDMKHGEFETGLWDQALTRGARLYATLVNDVHHIEDIDAYGYILIQAQDMSFASINQALTSGAFYAVESGFGITVARHVLVPGTDGGAIEVSAPGAALIRFMGEQGAILAEISADTARFPLAGVTGYVRVEIAAPNSRRAFMQPFFLN